jgi:hypothetical protein
VTFLDFFCQLGKDVPHQDDIALLFHLICSEIKQAGAENVLIVGRASKFTNGFKKRSPGLLPDFALMRYGFVDSAEASNPVESLLLSQMDAASKKYLGQDSSKIMVASFVDDNSIKRISRSVPASSKDGKVLFCWEG